MGGGVHHRLDPVLSENEYPIWMGSEVKQQLVGGKKVPMRFGKMCCTVCKTDKDNVQNVGSILWNII